MTLFFLAFCYVQARTINVKAISHRCGSASLTLWLVKFVYTHFPGWFLTTYTNIKKNLTIGRWDRKINVYVLWEISVKEIIWKTVSLLQEMKRWNENFHRTWIITYANRREKSVVKKHSKNTNILNNKTLKKPVDLRTIYWHIDKGIDIHF